MSLVPSDSSFGGIRRFGRDWVACRQCGPRTVGKIYDGVGKDCQEMTKAGFPKEEGLKMVRIEKETRSGAGNKTRVTLTLNLLVAEIDKSGAQPSG